MTNITLPREVVEQLMRMLDACLDDAIQVQYDLEQGYSKSRAGAQAKQVELSKEALNAGRAALASAERKAERDRIANEPTVPLGVRTGPMD